MKQTHLVRLFSWLVIIAVVVTMAPPALSSGDYANQGERITAALPELTQAADAVRLTASDSLHATMLGAREDLPVLASAAISTTLPVVEEAPALDAPLAEDAMLTAQATGGSYGTYAQRSYVYNNAGNIDSFEGVTQHYLDGAHKHAVTHVGGTTEAHRKYWYDNNGNATRRINASQVVTLTYGVENQVTSIIGSGVTPTSYLYDGDGKRVKATVGSGATQTNTVYIGNYYERDNGTTVRKYYYAGSVRVAMRTGGQTYYLLNDHLTSTAITTNSSGVRQTELR